MLVSFLTYAFGGPNKYSGRAIRAAHSRPVAVGLNESHFNKVAEHLQRTLLELSVPYELIQEVMTIAASSSEHLVPLIQLLTVISEEMRHNTHEYTYLLVKFYFLI